MNDKINYIDFIFFIKVLKDKFIYFLILSIITLSIPVYLYLNNETEFTVSIIIESESSMKLSNIQRDWETLHTLADLEMPYIGQENSKNISLSAIVLSDFLAILTSPTKFNSIYQEFYENGKITETFEDTYKNFSVVFDERSF